MSKRSQTPADPFAEILARAVANGRGAMSPTLARHVLGLGFDQADQDRVADLMSRNNAGRLSEAERAELDEYARVGTFLAILQSQARIALKKAAKVRA
jgi:hypothetical protein